MDELIQYKHFFKKLAFNSDSSKPRFYHKETKYMSDDEQFDFIDPFWVDFMKIMNSKAFRRLSDKTQVFPLPNNPHIRNRKSHTLEVMSISALISEALGLNTSLCLAIAAGHDIGHTPFGHLGENYISQRTGFPFNHAENAVLVAQKIERKGSGLNLKPETEKGIKYHSATQDFKMTMSAGVPLEFNVVKAADKFSYAFSDYSDALKRSDLISEKNDSNITFFGKYQRERVANCFKALLAESCEQGKISFSFSETAQQFEEFKKWLYKNVYAKIDFKIQLIYFDKIIEYFCQEKFFQECNPYLLLSLLTDREVMQFGQFFTTSTKPRLEALHNFGIMKMVRFIKGHEISKLTYEN